MAAASAQRGRTEVMAEVWATSLSLAAQLVTWLRAGEQILVPEVWFWEYFAPGTRSV